MATRQSRKTILTVKGDAHRCPDNGIGIDIEQVIDAATRDTILTTVVDRHEQVLQAGMASISPDHCLTLAFSVKESFFKASCGVVGR